MVEELVGLQVRQWRTWALVGRRTSRLRKSLPDSLQPELAQPGECGQVRAIEGSVGHVEVFRIDGARTPIIGRPRPLSSDRRGPAVLHPHL